MNADLSRKENGPMQNETVEESVEMESLKDESIEDEIMEERRFGSEKRTALRIVAVAVVLMLIGIVNVPAQDKVQITPNASLVSSYVWRGMYQSGAAFQPGAALGIKGFSLSVWGSTDFTGQGHKEFDVTAAYFIAGFSISVSDLWWAGESGIKNSNVSGLNHYFNYHNAETAHILEGALSYTLPVEKFPLKLSWYTMFWGGDKKVDAEGNLKQAFSSYFELAYPFNVGSVLMTASIGCSPWTSPSIYLNRGFAVTNVSLRADRALKITDSFSLPLFVQAIWNPDRQDIHCVFGLTF